MIEEKQKLSACCLAEVYNCGDICCDDSKVECNCNAKAENEKLQSFLESELTALHDKVREEIAGEIEKEKQRFGERTMKPLINTQERLEYDKVAKHCESFNQAVDLSASIARGKK